MRFDLTWTLRLPESPHFREKKAIALSFSLGGYMKVEWIISTWSRIRDGLIETIDKFTEDELTYIPFDGGYSVGQILLHIAQEERGEIQYGITGGLDGFPSDYSQGKYPTKASILSLLSDVHEHTIGYLRTLEDDDLYREIEAGWGGKHLLINMLWHVMEHEIHHRGELSFILGLLGREGLDA
jgi:uncharacterized damage-inducible protein DinB